MLRYVQNSGVNFYLRNVPRSSFVPVVPVVGEGPVDLCDEFDVLLRTRLAFVCQQCSGGGAGFSNFDWLRLCLPVSRGGAGFIPASLVSRVAFAAMFNDSVLRNVDSLLLPPPCDLSAGSRLASDVAVARSVLDSFSAVLSDESAAPHPRSQHRMVAFLMNEQEQEYRRLAPTAQLALLESGKKGGAWLQAIPSVRALQIPANLFGVIFATYFGLPLPDFTFAGTVHCVCKKRLVLDSYGHHLSICPVFGGPIAVHNAVSHLLMRMFRAAGHHVSDEKVLLGLEQDAEGEPNDKRGDMLVHTLRPGAQNTVLDVSITSVVSASGDGELGGDLAYRHAASVREKQKVDKHASDLKKMGFSFEPFVFEGESTVLGPQSQRVFDRLILELDSRCPMEPANWAARNHRQFWSQALSIAVVCGRARSVLGLFGAVVRANPDLALF